MFELLGDRVFNAEPYRRFLDEGLIVSAGSDAPVTMPDPIEWLYKACNNPNTINRMTVNEALRVCTYNGYYATFDEDKRGSLEVGKIADMVVMSKNPYNTKIEELNTIEVEQTILAGIPFTPKKQSFILTLIRGMLSREKV
jgi:predicted amidohydrolase YtcJ